MGRLGFYDFIEDADWTYCGINLAPHRPYLLTRFRKNCFFSWLLSFAVVAAWQTLAFFVVPRARLFAIFLGWPIYVQMVCLFLAIFAVDKPYLIDTGILGTTELIQKREENVVRYRKMSIITEYKTLYMFGMLSFLSLVLFATFSIINVFFLRGLWDVVALAFNALCCHFTIRLINSFHWNIMRRGGVHKPRVVALRHAIAELPVGRITEEMKNLVAHNPNAWMLV